MHLRHVSIASSFATSFMAACDSPLSQHHAFNAGVALWTSPLLSRSRGPASRHDLGVVTGAPGA